MAQSNPLPDPFLNNPSVLRNLDSIANSGVKAISASNRIFAHPGTVRITGGANITVGTDSLGISIAGGGGGGSAFTLSGSNLSVSDSAVLTGSNIVTVKTSAGQKFVIDATTAAQTVQPVGSLDLTGNTTGTMATLPFASNIELAGGNGITLSQSSGASSSRITISGVTQSNQAFTLSGSNTSFSNSAVLSGSNAATIRSTTGQAFIVDVPTQTSETGSLQPAGNTTGTTANLPFFGQIQLAAGNNMTLSQSSGASSSRITLSAFNQTVQPVGSLDIAGNTTGTTASLPFASNIELAGGNNITLSQSSGTNSSRITISGPNTVAQSSETGSLIPAGNTTGTTTSLPFFQNIQLAGGNNITLSQSSGTNSTRVTISAFTQSSESGSLIPGGNTAGTTASLPMFQNISLAGGPNVTLSQSSGASSTNISISAQDMRPYVNATGPEVGALANIGQGSDARMTLTPLDVPANITAANRFIFPGALSGNSGSSGALTFSVGAYSLAGSTATLVSSTSLQLSWTSGSSTNTASCYGGRSGTRFRSVALNSWSITPGDYLFAFYSRTTNDGSMSMLGQTNAISMQGADGAVNEVRYWLPMVYSTSFSTAMPASFNLTDTAYVRTGASVSQKLAWSLTTA